MKIYQVDSFTSVPFTGNPAGVYLLEEEISAELMQNIALEMNLSETAFALKIAPNTYTIKFYTPNMEIDLCGHATLATAHILYELGEVSSNETITFNSNVGPLDITKSNTWINMDFPSVIYTQIPITQKMEHALSCKIEAAYSGNGWSLVNLESKENLIHIEPDFRTFINSGLGHSIITCMGDNKFDFYYRCFVPQSGILEDPVTGSAQTILIPFWHHKTKKQEFLSQQISARTGILKGEYRDMRTLVSGQAVTIFSSQWII